MESCLSLFGRDTLRVAFLFGISQSIVSNEIHHIIPILRVRLQHEVQWFGHNEALAMKNTCERNGIARLMSKKPRQKLYFIFILKSSFLQISLKIFMTSH